MERVGIIAVKFEKTTWSWTDVAGAGGLVAVVENAENIH